jgi:hypothetical protein
LRFRPVSVVAADIVFIDNSILLDRRSGVCD